MKHTEEQLTLADEFIKKSNIVNFVNLKYGGTIALNELLCDFIKYQKTPVNPGKKPIKEHIPRDVIKNKVYDIIADHLGCEENEVTENSNLQDDLGVDSLDFVEIILKLESEFNILIPDEDAENIRTVKDTINTVYNII